MESPTSITSWMGDTHLPIMTIPDSIIPVDLYNVRIPQRYVVENSGYQHAFCIDNVMVDLGAANMLDIKCCGNFCDALEQFAGGKLATKCSCYTLTKRDADLSGVFDLQLTTPDGSVMRVRHFTSKSFTRFFIVGEVLPVGLGASQFCDRRQKTLFRQSVENILQFVNTGGVAPIGVATAAGHGDIPDDDREKRSGFTVQGWVRRGTVADLAADPVQRNETRRMVDSSELTYHITSIRPTCDKFIKKLGGLEGLRFNARLLVNPEPPATVVAGGNGQAVAAANRRSTAATAVASVNNAAGPASVSPTRTSQLPPLGNFC